MRILKSVYRRVLPGSFRTQLRAAWELTDREWWKRWLRGRQLRSRVRQGEYLTAVALPHATLTVDLRDIGVGVPLFRDRSYEEPETRFFRAVLRPGMVVYDIGANLGYISTLVASLVGPSGRVVAFEPHPHNYDLLVQNVTKNEYSNVTTFNVALGADTGTLSLYESESNFGDHQLYAVGSEGRKAVEVRVESLDGLRVRERLPPPDIIKIDVQGYENFVLQGMTETLRDGRPLSVLAEFWPWGLRRAGTHPVALLIAFRSHGFSVSTLDDAGQIVPADWDALTFGLAANLTPSENDYPNLLFRRP